MDEETYLDEEDYHELTYSMPDDEEDQLHATKNPLAFSGASGLSFSNFSFKLQP